MSVPPPHQRILVTIEQAAAMVSARRADVRAELVRLGLVRMTPWGERVPVDALRAWALGLPATNEPPAAVAAEPVATPAVRPSPIRLLSGGTLDKGSRRK